MKPSKYNYSIANGDGNIVLYNTNSDQILVVNPQLADLWESHQNNVDGLEAIHPAYYDMLKKKEFILDNDNDETADLIDRWMKQLDDEKQLRLTINPTLDCNFRCWYCYEEHKDNMHMDKATFEATGKFIDKQCRSEKISCISLSFFGGEPLIHADDIVLPLINETTGICKELGKDCHIEFTTNAYLLTPETIDRISAATERAFFQITLDGNEALHNKTRFTAQKEGSYKTIVVHILYALQHGMDVSIRINYTSKNINAIPDILADFEPIKDNKHYYFDFHKVWQAPNSETLDKDVEHVKSIFREKGFKVRTDSQSLKTHCYADHKNCIVINYNGDIYKCTARDFKKHNRIGTLLSDGNIDIAHGFTNSLRKQYERPACRDCIIFPICHAGCSQDKIENPDGNQCLRKYGKREKEKIITERILELTQNL